MLLSLYPTDPRDVRDAVVEQAAAQPGEPVFTSLHIPESAHLEDYCAFLQRTSKARGLTWWADISPLTLQRLDLDLAQVGELRRYGVIGLRLDFGFSIEQMRRIAASGLAIALNASTVSDDDVVALADQGVVGWHNFYPRPDTGLEVAYFERQSALFTSRGLPLVSFVPGEVTWRAPLHEGLPTLEHQRGSNAWVCAAELRRLVPKTRLACAEGVLRPEHLEWIRTFERDGVVTLPLSEAAPGAEFLLEGTWTLRPEQTGRTQRLEGTRTPRPALGCLASTPERLSGGIYVDGPERGRYDGEVHVAVRTLPPDRTQRRVAQVGAAYLGLLPTLTGRERVRFVRL